MDVHEKVAREDLAELSMLAGSLVQDQPPYLDYDPFGYRIVPCAACSSWWAEVVCRRDSMRVVREWHDPDCTYLAESR